MTKMSRELMLKSSLAHTGAAWQVETGH